MNAKTEARVKAHGVKLLAIFPGARPRDPVKLCRRLRRIEAAAHRDAERWCTGDIDEREYAARKQNHYSHLSSVLANGEEVFINSDPRGYALKITAEHVYEHGLDIPTDWGGYGLIAPDLTA